MSMNAKLTAKPNARKSNKTHSNGTHAHKVRPAIVRPAVVFSPNLLAGINAIANLVKPTLGPRPRMVAMERTSRGRAPELLDDAATLARRIVQLPHATDDVGAMMLRHALWRMHELVGDGAATTAVLAQALVQHASKAAAAGANPMQLRHGIEAGINLACEALRAQAQPVSGSPRARKLLTALVRSTCSDEELAERLAEAVTYAGPDAYIEIMNHEPRRIDRDYVEGSLWEAPWHNANFSTDKARTITRMEDAAFVIVESKIESAEHALEGMKRLHEMGFRKVAIMVGEVSEDAMNFFNTAHHRGLMQLALIKSPGFDANRAMNLQDISALTGARMLMGDGQAFAHVQAEDVGLVRRLWVNDKKAGLIGGNRDSLALRVNIKKVRADIESLKDLDRLTDLRKRLGRLTGSWVILRVGGVTNGHAEARQDEARRLVRALQTAVRGGVVAGGGAALLACQPALNRAIKTSKDEADPMAFDYQMGLASVQAALAAPLTTILQNAGHEASPWVWQIRKAGLPHGFDVKTETMVNMFDAGIVDSAEVLERALRNAGSMAVMAVTTEVVIHHKKPTLVVNT